EHVLPQSPAPTSQWERWFPDGQQRERLVHRLGNLVLLTHRKNSPASNFDFEKKKTAYFAKKGVSPFALTTQVLQEQTWTPEVIERRQASLPEELKRLWRLYPLSADHVVRRSRCTITLFADHNIEYLKLSYPARNDYVIVPIAKDKLRGLGD